MQCALVLSYPEYAERFGKELAEALTPHLSGQKVNLVVAPAMGGIVIGHEVARALGARSLFTERDGTGNMVLRRGFSVNPGQTAVVVEDVITTGGSLREVIDLLRAEGVQVLAGASIIDRSGNQVDLGVKRASLATLHVQNFTEERCPLCRQRVPIQKPGSRAV
jgi:orotate phosphoribosyltransferase